MAKVIATLSFLLVIAGCANHPCREIPNKEPLADNLPAAGSGGAPPAEKANASPGTSTVLVYKSDGSLQCGQAKGLSPDEMQKKELKGVTIVSKRKQSDGLMHIQVCGTPTGKINVFEIPQIQGK